MEVQDGLQFVLMEYGQQQKKLLSQIRSFPCPSSTFPSSEVVPTSDAIPTSEVILIENFPHFPPRYQGMRPALQGFNIITWYLILATEEPAIKFMQKMGLIPTYLSPCPACPLCGYESKSQRMPTKKLGFRYVCDERRKKKKKKNCYGTCPNYYFYIIALLLSRFLLPSTDGSPRWTPVCFDGIRTTAKEATFTD
ncbi:hypothetical protein CEXT_148731 [Caerostris extrusa]|uniref:Uncharacterized protein n=1 Tax=Caerostris extrusa TaxID=172846 RepID=A0AAV4Y9A5_CAEEX|nr:hypothetical protein CEXT_148731 [Caerostris extrusa]